MSCLQRIRSASFNLEDCLTFSQIEERMAQGTLEVSLYPLERAISYLPKYRINDKVAEKVKNGAVLPIPDSLKSSEGPFIVETEEGIALAVYQKHPNKPSYIKPVKVLRNEQ